MAFVSADRQRQGNFATLSVTANTTMSDVKRNSQGPRLVHSKERAEAEGWVSKLRTKTSSTEAPMATLSGGNQQKVMVGRWLSADRRVIVLEEPTAGVDVGAKADIYRLLEDSLAVGLGVVLVSSDFEEVASVAHRALVFVQGRVTEQLAGDQLTVGSLTAASSGANLLIAT